MPFILSRFLNERGFFKYFHLDSADRLTHRVSDRGKRKWGEGKGGDWEIEGKRGKGEIEGKVGSRGKGGIERLRGKGEIEGKGGD